MAINKNLRVDLPKNAEGIIQLANLIAAKHLADGANSVLLPLISANWTLLAGDAVDARTLHDTAEATKYQAATDNEVRNTNFALILNSILSTRDILAGIYAENNRKLSDWGFIVTEAANSKPSKRKYKIEIPRNPDDILKLATAIFTKHTADGAASPLHHLIDYPWAVSGALLSATANLHNNAGQLRKDSEKAYEARDIILKKLSAALKVTRTYLLGIYKNTPKTLGDWGFIVNDTATIVPKKSVSALKNNSNADGLDENIVI